MYIRALILYKNLPHLRQRTLRRIVNLYTNYNDVPRQLDDRVTVLMFPRATSVESFKALADIVQEPHIAELFCEDSVEVM